MLVLRTQRVMFGCPAGNIDGGYGIKIATDQMFVIILSRTSTLVDRSDRTLQSEIAARDERTLNRHQYSRKRLRDATIVLQTRVFSFVIKKR